MNTKKKKPENPFVEARSINEFFKMLRAELTRLYGRRLRHWKTSHVFIDDCKEELSFTLDTDAFLYGTQFGIKKFTWYDVIEAADLYQLPKSHRLNRSWEGLGIFTSSGGGSGDKLTTKRAYARLDLKYLPKIRRLYRDNLMRKGRRLEVTKKSKQYQILQGELWIRRTQLESLKESLFTEFDRKHPRVDLFTGKPTS